MNEIALLIFGLVVQPYLLYLAYMFGRNSMVVGGMEAESVLTPARAIAKTAEKARENKKEDREYYPPVVQPGSILVTDDDLLLDEEQAEGKQEAAGRNMVQSLWDRIGTGR